MICDDSLVSLSSGTGAHRAGLNLSAVSVFKWKDTTKRMSNAGNKKNTLTCESKEWINRVWRASAAPLPSASSASWVCCMLGQGKCLPGLHNGGRVYLGPSSCVGVGGEAFTVCSAQLDPHKPPWLRLQSAGSLLTSERRNTAPGAVSAFITPSAWRTDAAAQSSFLQILMRFLFIFSNPLCLNISTACTVYLKCSVSFKSMFYGKSISIRNIVQILSNWLNWYCSKPLTINQFNYIWYSILIYQVLNLKQPRNNVTNDLLLLLLLIKFVLLLIVVY